MIGVLMMMALAAEKAPMTQPKREFALRFAACVRRRAPDRVSDLLSTEPESDRERRQAQAIADAYGACIKERNVFSVPINMLRGQLAESSFQADPALVARASDLAAEPPVLPDVAGIDKAASKVPADGRDRFYAERFRAQFARCVVAANPGGVAGIIVTEPASSAEHAAMLKIGDAMMRCMPQGVSYSMKPAEFRPYLMSELYYRAVAAAPGPRERVGK